MDCDKYQQLKILKALGSADEADLRELEQLESAMEDEFESYSKLASMVSAFATPLKSPPADLKNKILNKVKALKEAPNSTPEQETEAKPAAPEPTLHFQFSAAENDAGWIPLKLEGASIKVLSVNNETGKVVALGKLEPGTRYPAHIHKAEEDIYILSGDLNIGDQKMVAGDFHHADAGSQHEENWSKNGCTILAVTSIENFKDQLPE